MKSKRQLLSKKSENWSLSAVTIKLFWTSAVLSKLKTQSLSKNWNYTRKNMKLKELQVIAIIACSGKKRKKWKKKSDSWNEELTKLLSRLKKIEKKVSSTSTSIRPLNNLNSEDSMPKMLALQLNSEKLKTDSIKSKKILKLLSKEKTRN